MQRSVLNFLLDTAHTTGKIEGLLLARGYDSHTTALLKNIKQSLEFSTEHFLKSNSKEESN